MPISLWFICGFYKWQHNQNIFITLLTLPEHQLLLIIFSSSSLFSFSSLILSHSKLYFHQDNRTALMFAASNGHSGVVKLLIDAGAAIEAKTPVSRRISICTCVCVCVCVCYILASQRCFILFFYFIIAICRIRRFHQYE